MPGEKQTRARLDPMATLQKLFHDWLEWRLATARLRVVAMNALASEPIGVIEQETAGPERVRPSTLVNGNLCPGNAV